MGGPKTQCQLFPHGEPRFKIPAVDDSQTKSAWRHGVVLRRFVLMEGNLNTGDIRRLAQPGGDVFWGVLIMHTVGAKQDNTVSFLSMGIIELPTLFRI